MGLFCPCVIIYNTLAAEAGQNPILCCLGSASIYTGIPVFWYSGCALQGAFREKKGIPEDFACADLVCGGLFHQLSVCRMARHLASEAAGTSDSGVMRMDR